MKFRGACVVVGLLSLVSLTVAQTSTQTASALPRLVRFGGTVKDLNGDPMTGVVGITFAFYSEKTGGAPLWLETENATADGGGHYTVLLGSTKPDGLPAELFTSEQARWVGVQVSGQPEQPRVLLVSAPYALKAGDAETIGGLPPSAFVLAAPAGSAAAGPTGGNAGATPGSVVPLITSDVTTTGGTVNAIPLFSTATNIQNSILTQTAATAVNVGGKLNLPATGAATATAGKISQVLDFVASSFSSTSSAAVNQTFQWQAQATGNDTATPSGTLALLFGSGTAAPTETGLRIASDGQIVFATGQTFPGTGAGTITGVTAGTDLTGGGTTGKVTLNVNTTKIPQLGVANTFTGNQTVNGTVSATSAASNGVVGNTSSATGNGVEGNVTATTGTTAGVYGTTSSSTGYGVKGQSPNVGVYGTSVGPSKQGAGDGHAGVWGDTEGIVGNGSYVGVLGTADQTSAGEFLNNGVSATVLASNAGSGNGVQASTASATGYGVIGSVTATTGTTAGVEGTTASATGNGVLGQAQAAGGTGVYGATTNGIGVWGYDAATSGSAVGVLGSTLSPAGIAVIGESGSRASATEAGAGVSGLTLSPTSYGVEGYEYATTGTTAGVFGQTYSSAGYGVEGVALTATGPGYGGPEYVGGEPYGVFGIGGIGVVGMSSNGANAGGYFAGYPQTGSAGPTTDGVVGAGGNASQSSGGGSGVTGVGGPGAGLMTDGPGGDFFGGNSTTAGDGVEATGGSGDGIDAGLCCTGLPDTYAGYFNGDVEITGTLSAATKDFKIDHPLDPASKYLVHASVESSEMVNIYTGNITTDGQGHATVQLPEWFEVLNTDFRYQLTVIGQFAQAIVAREIESNRFEIRTSVPSVKVSWQVTGVRQDAYAKAHPLVVEQEKDARLRGFYIHPELYGAPAEKQIEWARRPQMMKRIQEMRARQLAAAQKQTVPQPARPKPTPLFKAAARRSTAQTK